MRIRLSRSIVPNLFTVLNIYFGFMSIIAASTEQFVPALWYIVLSAVCDSLDGLMARLTKSSSEFGVELDSLADVVGFGVAPSYLLYALVLNSWGTLGLLVAVAPLVMGALRLARFNVQLVGFSKDHFTGMPIPLSALTLVSYVLYFGADAIRAQEPLQYGLVAITTACGVLMVSRVRYPVVPMLTLRSFRERPVLMALFSAAAVVVIATLGKLLLPVLLLLIVGGPLLAAGRKAQGAATARGGSAKSRPGGLKKREAADDYTDPDDRKAEDPRGGEEGERNATIDSSS